MSASTPAPYDLDGWRRLLAAAPDLPERRALVHAWAAALGAAEVTEPGRSPVLQLPDGCDPDAAGAVYYYGMTAGAPVRMPAP